MSNTPYEKNMKTGNSIVFICRKNQNIEEITFNDVKEDMVKILKSAEIL